MLEFIKGEHNMKDKFTCSKCRKKDTSECPIAKAERTVTGEFSGFKTAFEDWEGCSRGEGRPANGAASNFSGKARP